MRACPPRVKRPPASPTSSAAEHHALAEFLVALAAFDEARGWVELGYSSLFYFLLRELGLPKGPAYYRMTAAGLIRKYPELVEPLRDGRLHLTSVTQLARVITPENRAEVPSRFFHLSKREAREVVAELVPAAAPPLRTVVTAVRSAPTAPTPPSALQVLPEELPPAHPAAQTRNSGDAPEVVPPLPRQQRAQVDPLTAEKSRLHVTVSRRLLEKLSAAKDALSHSHPGASEETILEVGLDLILQRHARRRGIGAKPRAVAPKKAGAKAPPPSTPRSRHVPAHVWRAVWERDRGCCLMIDHFLDDAGRRSRPVRALRAPGTRATRPATRADHCWISGRRVPPRPASRLQS